MTPDPELLSRRLADLPTKAGIYLMKDAAGQIIYVGKAAVLRNRVRSYFQSPGGLAPRTRSMVEHVADLEWIVTSNELEALLLESNYIKQHRPRYNVRLRDDKQYLYLRVTLQEDYPRVERVRRIAQDGARYFGPYASTKSLNETLALVKRLFPYRSCDLKLAEGSIDRAFRPCLEFHINRCLAPCNASCTKDEYRATIEQVCLFLEGKQEQVVRRLEAEMAAAAEAMQFERAARLRDQVAAITRVVERQRVVSLLEEDQDAVGMARDGSGACVQIMQARQGKVIGTDHVLLDAAEDSGEGEVLAAFLVQYYQHAAELPPEILLPAEPDDRETLEQWLRSLGRGKPRLLVPKRGGKRDFVALAAENAAQSLAEERALWQASRQRTVGAAGELAAALGLPRFPHRIECYDNSNIQGSNPVAAMVVFLDGQPAKGEYRKFKIKTVEGPDDFRSMAEVLRRRFSRALRAQAAEGAAAGDGEGDAETGAGGGATTAGRRGAAGSPGEAPDAEGAAPTGGGADRIGGAAVAAVDVAATDGSGVAGTEDVDGATAAGGWAALPDLVIVDGGKGQV